MLDTNQTKKQSQKRNGKHGAEQIEEEEKFHLNKIGRAAGRE